MTIPIAVSRKNDFLLCIAAQRKPSLAVGEKTVAAVSAASEDFVPGSPMTDDLRTRIAAAVGDYHQRWGIKCECGADHAHAYGVADAVIRELDDMGIIHLSKVKHDGAFKYGEHYGI